MVNIDGRYDFHRDGVDLGMQIVEVDPSGQIVEAQIGQSPMHGVYNPTTDGISFNDARQPGDTLFVTYYTGYVMLNGAGAVSAMAGTYQEQELVIGPVREAARLSAASESAAGGTATVVPAPGVVVRITRQGGWYATWLDEPLV